MNAGTFDAVTGLRAVLTAALIAAVPFHAATAQDADTDDAAPGGRLLERFDRNDDGSFGVLGRWSDWVFPPGSFGMSRGRLAGLEVPTMSPEGMLAMKEQYANLRNGAPLRDKDVGDIAALRALLDTTRAAPLSNPGDH